MEFEFEQSLQPLRDQIAQLETKRLKGDGVASSTIATLKRKLETETARIYAHLSPWDTVQVARHLKRVSKTCLKSHGAGLLISTLNPCS